MAASVGSAPYSVTNGLRGTVMWPERMASMSMANCSGVRLCSYRYNHHQQSAAYRACS